MPGDEAKIERKVCKDALRYHGVESIKQKRVGWPDQLFLLGRGEVLYIEFKRPLEEPTAYQYHILQYLTDNGYRAVWVDNYAAAMQHIREALADIHMKNKQKRGKK